MPPTPCPALREVAAVVRDLLVLAVPGRLEHRHSRPARRRRRSMTAAQPSRSFPGSRAVAHRQPAAESCNYTAPSDLSRRHTAARNPIHQQQATPRLNRTGTGRISGSLGLISGDAHSLRLPDTIVRRNPPDGSSASVVTHWASSRSIPRRIPRPRQRCAA